MVVTCVLWILLALSSIRIQMVVGQAFREYDSAPSSRFLPTRNYACIVVAVAVAGGTLLVALGWRLSAVRPGRRGSFVKRAAEWVGEEWPLMGRLLRKNRTSRFQAALVPLLGRGVPVATATRISAMLSESPRIIAATERLVGNTHRRETLKLAHVADALPQLRALQTLSTRKDVPAQAAALAALAAANVEQTGPLGRRMIVFTVGGAFLATGFWLSFTGGAFGPMRDLVELINGIC